MSGAAWPAPWTSEDGGPRRTGEATGLPGLGLQAGERLEVAAARDAVGTTMLVHRGPGELFALRHDLPWRGPQRDAVGAWVERLDPGTLDVLGSSPRLPGGAFWPGGMAAHASGDLHVVFGRWAHRLSCELDVLAARRLPVDRPYNSFVLLDGGELVTKDCDAPAGRAPSTVSVLDPSTLEDVVAPLRLPEPCIARLSSDGDEVVVVGSTRLFRLRLDRGAGRLVLDDAWRPTYGPAPGRSFGWDPVVTDRHVLWMDNGRNHTDRTMVGSGTEAGPVRLWWARRDDGTTRSTEVSGLPFGTQSNPPAFDARSGVVVAYDAGNAVLRAWRMVGDDLEPLWRRDGFAHAGHLIVFGDTRELVAQDFRDRAAVLRRRGVRRVLRPLLPLASRAALARRASLRLAHDELVVLDLDTGEDKGRVAVPSPSQAFLFPAPGHGRDVLYQSLTTIARVAVAPSTRG